MSDLLASLLSRRPWLLADGGMGSSLFERGLESGYAPELWNVEHPDRIAEVHRGFVTAGADIILTNSFGGTRHRLKLHQAQGRVAELNEAAAHVARAAAAERADEVVIAGSMGPTGEILEPLGPMTAAEAAEAFAEQAAALARGGVDVLWIETLSSVEELEAAIAGARQTGLPIVSTFSFDTNGKTMMGITPAQLAAIHERTHLAACGSNCGTGAAELVASIVNLASASAPDAVLVAKANCGIPQYVDGAIRFNGTPELMARYACLAYDAGARIIGGCCGTSAEHLRAMRAALLAHVRGQRPDTGAIESMLGPVSAGARALLDGPSAAGEASAAERASRRAGTPRARHARG
jgi:5-methyltetrahydrofolate--homocysteine methyltransferase